jgi:hypothetical protein
MTTQLDRERLEFWPDEKDRLRELEDALLAAGVRPPTRKLSEWETVRERPAWRAFIARHFGI